MTRVARACALSLIVLIVLPFTAPFASVDAASLFGQAPARDRVPLARAPQGVVFGPATALVRPQASGVGRVRLLLAGGVRPRVRSRLASASARVGGATRAGRGAAVRGHIVPLRL